MHGISCPLIKLLLCHYRLHSSNFVINFSVVLSVTVFCQVNYRILGLVIILKVDDKLKERSSAKSKLKIFIPILLID